MDIEQSGVALHLGNVLDSSTLDEQSRLILQMNLDCPQESPRDRGDS